MAIFKMNFNKEGKGVEKNAPERNILLTGAGLYKRNFWNLIKINFMYFVASIPMMIILGVIFTVMLYPHLAPAISEMAEAGTVDAQQAEATYLGVYACLFIAEMIFFLGSGPASSAVAYAVKCMTREEHVWIWTDFKKQFLGNFKQSIIVSIIDVIVTVLAFNAAAFYAAAYKGEGNIVYFVLMAAVVLFLILFFFIHIYIYQLIVTFDNKLTAIYRNALLLAIGKFPQNIVLTVIPAVIAFYILGAVTPAFSAILSALLLFITMRFPMEFYAARTLKSLIDNSQAGEEKGQDD